MHRVVLAICLLTLGGALAPAEVAAEDAAAREARWRRGLRSAAAQVRDDTVAEAVAAGAAAVPCARAWTKDPDVRVRVGGWGVLRRLGRPEDLRAAVLATGDLQPAVALAAAHALVTLSEQLPLGPDPWIPRGAVGPRAQAPLASALSWALERGPRDGVPAAIHRLGEGSVPSLVALLASPRVDTGGRAASLRALAVIGGEAARQAIGALVSELDDERRHPLWTAWWRSVLAVGCGRGLAQAQDLVVRLAEKGANNRNRGPLRTLGWRDRLYFFRFVSSCPPGAGVEHLREYLAAVIEDAAMTPRRRFYPTLAAPIIRAYLVLGEPTDEALRAAVLCAQGRAGRGVQRRGEELGEVLALLAPYKARKGVQEGLEELLASRALPRTVTAWATYLLGKTPRAEVVALAASLMDHEEGATTLAERRLGARLMTALGVPPAERIRATLKDLDEHLRMQALDWVMHAVEKGSVPALERDRAMRAALLDPNDGVFLVAAERASDDLGPAQRTRLLRLGLSGSLGLRGRAWRVVERRLNRRSSGRAAFTSPGGLAPLDRRLEAAATARAVWGL